MLLLVVEEEVDVELIADCAACNAADAILTLAATWLSWDLMAVEAAASAVESWRPSDDVAEAAEAVSSERLLLNSLINDDSNDSMIAGRAAMTEVKLLMSLIKSRDSMTGTGVLSASGPRGMLGTWLGSMTRSRGSMTGTEVFSASGPWGMPVLSAYPQYCIRILLSICANDTDDL